MRSKPRLGPFTASIAVVFAALAMAATSTSTETSRLRIAGPAWMLSADNPLKQGLPYDGSVEVELPGIRYDPPVEIPTRPRDWPPPPDVAEVDQILAHLRDELELDGRVLLHGVAYYMDFLVALVAVEEASSEPWRAFALVDVPSEGWQHSAAALREPVIEVIFQGWRESGWIKMIPRDAAPAE
ncbi:MAG: hypothetical protein OER90_19990 [Gemmatimonadota bacterium]|nr:hypothetical protein [Gemmatimonadota bacterium]